MEDVGNYYYKNMPNENLGIDIILSKEFKYGSILEEHWHEHLQIFYFIDGKGFLNCGNKKFNVYKEDVVIINSRETHYLESLDDELKFYIIRIDLSFLFSDQVDLCQSKYLAPSSQNFIVFKNLINNDSEVLKFIDIIIDEYMNKKIGYELSIKGNLYNLVVVLIRNYIDEFITEEKFNFKLNNLKRFEEIFNYIENNYNRKICTKTLSSIAHISPYYFCRTFKELTGKTTTEYINELRLKKSIEFLKKGTMTITEIAIDCGFNDINYFCRIFKKKYGVSPTRFIINLNY